MGQTLLLYNYLKTNFFLFSNIVSNEKGWGILLGNIKNFTLVLLSWILEVRYFDVAFFSQV